MKLCYALRRGVFFPNKSEAFGELPEKRLRPQYLKLVKAAGFDGLEVPAGSAQGITEAGAKELGKELLDAGLPAVCVRGGGPVAHAREGAQVRERLRKVVDFAGWIGASVVNSGIVTPATLPGGPGSTRQGEPTSQGASRYASESDFVETAKHLKEAGQRAGDKGMDLSIEIHQGSIADNSWSGLRLVDLIGLPNVGVNPDLGNIYWHFEEPEETSGEAIVAMAPKAKYWHCKNLKKVHFPELRHAIFLRVPLDLGDIDYRYAVSAMIVANYQGYMAIEGARDGDQLSQDIQSATYAKRLIAEASA